MTFDELRVIEPGVWIKQISTEQYFIRMADGSSTDELSNDEMNVCSGGFFNIDTGRIIHASHLIDDACKVTKLPAAVLGIEKTKAELFRTLNKLNSILKEETDERRTD